VIGGFAGLPASPAAAAEWLELERQRRWLVYRQAWESAALEVLPSPSERFTPADLN
jgi:hypothetical protein